jgi:Secretion system C-terminal sorting domain/Galactose oxidase, central domain
LNNTWTQIANYPVSGIETNLVYSIGSYGYAGCGGDGSTNTNIMYKYDTTTNTWTSIASVPVAGGGLRAPSSFVLNDTAYSVSGQNNSLQFIRSVFNYNSITNTWGALANFPDSASWLGVGFSIGNCGYVTTGTDSLGSYLSYLWQYGPNSKTGVSEIKNNICNVNIFPNPSNGIFNLSYSNLNAINPQLIITDVLGRTISDYTVPGKQGKLAIDESQLSSGIYFYRVNSNEGLLASGKFVIEK